MINGVTADSRQVKPGYAFVAVKGRTVDGHDFLKEALEKGAVALYGEKDLDLPNYQKVKDSKKKLGELAAQVYGNPSQNIKVIGVTGTKGKTTTGHILHHILTNLGHETGLISSISYPGLHVTTPDVVTLNRMLSEMVKKGSEYAVLEVSSHGIDQGRVEGIKFEVGILTNIAPEHLDYHKTFKEYKKIKMSFINSAKIKVISPKSTNLNILPGEFNNLNAEAAVEAAVKLGFEKEKALQTLSSFELPSGRLEEIETNKGFRVFIDFAHTPNSLEAALKYLKTQTHAKLISVFGCAGERDRRKRTRMGEISAQLADLSVFTTEDSRTENIFDILRLMKKKASGNYYAIPERGEAIAFALSQAKKGDVVGFFGKGHEKSMAYKGFEHPWEEKEMINNQLNLLEGVSVIVLAAGKGSRMKCRSPKVLKEICGRPMLAYTLESLRKIGASDIVVVVSFRKNEVMRRFPHSVVYAYQQNPKGGTADAAKVGLSKVKPLSKYVVVINGDDSAFYTPRTIKAVIDSHIESNSILTFVSLIKKDPFGLGRVVRNNRGELASIVEEKDATDEQKKVNEVNDGLYVFTKKWLDENIKKVKKGPQGEFYIVDLVKMAVDNHEKISIFKLPNDDEWHGINTPEQLAAAEEKMKQRLQKDLKN